MSHHYTFAHLSDPHLTSLENVSFRDLLNKRMLGYWSWKMHRRHEHRREMLQRLVDDLRQRNPDHTVITGDLTHLGLPEEFSDVREWLDALGSSESVTVIPGNHETYVPTAWERTFAKWTPFLRSDGMNGDARRPCEDEGLFPSVRIRGRIAFIGLSSAFPSPPFLATGHVDEEQLHRLDMALRECLDRGLCRVVLIHHPPTSGTVKWRKSLTNAQAVQAVLERRGAELVLHGHAHASMLQTLSFGDRVIPVVGVPSASAMGRSPDRVARYHVYQISGEPEAWDIRVSVYGYSHTQQQFQLERNVALCDAEPSMARQT